MIGSLILSSILMALATIALWSMNGSVFITLASIPVLLTVAYLFRPIKPDVSARRTILSGQLSHGGPLVVRVKVTNEGHALEQVILKDQFPGRFTLSDGVNKILCSLDPGESVEWEYTLIGVRGDYLFPGVHITVCSRLGLFEQSEFIREETQIIVKPMTQPLKKVEIRPRRTQVYTGTIPTNIGGSGIDYFGVREFAVGDSPRLINWKALARHQDQIYTNEFERERMANIGLVFDCRKSSYDVREPRQFLDHIAPAAVELTYALSREGNRVGLLVYGAFLDWTSVGSGKAHREKIVRAISKIELRDHDVFESLERIPTRLFPPQSQIIMISPLQEGDFQPIIRLRARGFQIIVISPDPLKFDWYEEENSNRRIARRVLRLERELLIRRLGNSGIQVINWDLSLPFHQIVDRYLNHHSIRNIDIFKVI